MPSWLSRPQAVQVDHCRRRRLHQALQAARCTRAPSLRQHAELRRGDRPRRSRANAGWQTVGSPEAYTAAVLEGATRRLRGAELESAHSFDDLIQRLNRAQCLGPPQRSRPPRAALSLSPPPPARPEPHPPPPRRARPRRTQDGVARWNVSRPLRAHRILGEARGHRPAARGELALVSWRPRPARSLARAGRQLRPPGARVTRARSRYPPPRRRHPGRLVLGRADAPPSLPARPHPPPPRSRSPAARRCPCPPPAPP